MNDNLLVIEPAGSIFSAELGCRKMEYTGQSRDEDIDSWLIRNKQMFVNTEKIIIPVRLGREDAELMGLYIGLHIRLTRELENIRCLPMLFISEDSREEILSGQISKQKMKSGLLLFTKGSFLISAFDLEENVSKSLSPLNEQTLIENVIHALNIENTKDAGHQLANDWGAFRLAKFAGYKLTVLRPASLYFKYKDSLTNNENVPVTNNIIGHFRESCKALLVDDNAGAGWSEILRHILRSRVGNNENPTHLEVIPSFEEADGYTKYIDYDIIFLDLRLNKEEDRANYINDVEDFTGTKILKKIKAINPGIQVIMFTASNKVWNIQKLIEIGADGYYIKESPEYILSSRFSKANYDELIKTIQNCLSRKPLKVIYNQSEGIKSALTELVRNRRIDKSFGRSASKYIDLAYKIIDEARTENDFAMGYLVLFKCIELLNDNFIVRDAGANWLITIDGRLKQFHYNSNTNSVFENSPSSFRNGTPSTFEKTAGIASQVLQFSNADLVAIYHSVQRRNKYVHADESGGLTPTQVEENGFIYDYSGYTKLIGTLNNIFTKLLEHFQR